MKNYHSRIIVLLLITLFVFNPVFSQKKVLAKPKLFERPDDYFGSKQYETQISYEEIESSDKSKDKAWEVFSDRNNNPVYDAPNGNKVGTINFPKRFYVLKHKGHWIQLVDAKIGELKTTSTNPQIIGWVEKKKMLLWNEGISSYTSRIHKKALILNKANEIKAIREGEKEVAQFYDSPTGGNELGKINIYSFFFILKKEGNRMLLSKTSKLEYRNYDKQILGWVDKKRITEWNNRVCLEPNFDEAAFEERKNNPDLQFRLFSNLAASKKYANGTKVGTTDIFMDASQDPVNIKSAKQRMDKNIIRFPMVSINNTDEKIKKRHFRSGAILEIGGEARRALEDLKEKDRNINLFFLIEATPATQGYQQEIAKLIRSAKSEILSQYPRKKIKTGALLYKDVPEGSKMVQHKALTANPETVANFVENASFLNSKDQDDYTAMYCGLREAMNRANFKKKETNIIISIGTFADYSANRFRADDKCPELEIIQLMNAYDVCLHPIQLENQNPKVYANFVSQYQNFILEKEKMIYNYINKNGANLCAPNWIDNQLKCSTCPVEIQQPKLNGKIDKSQLMKIAHQLIEKDLNFRKEFIENIEKTIDGNTSEKSIWGKGSLGFLQWLIDNGIDRKLLKGNWELHTEVFIPTFVRDAKYPTVSYVLFMPEKDLRNYYNAIDFAFKSIEDVKDERKALEEMITSLVEHLTGSSGFFGSDLETESLQDIQHYIHGLKKEGLPDLSTFSSRMDFKLIDIRNERIVSDEEIEFWMDRFDTIRERVKNILKDGKGYDFCRHNENTDEIYYWIDLRDIF